MKKFIPNLITLLNLSCGIIALRFAMDQAFDMALLWFFLGIVFDFFDGFAARWLKVTSPLGLQLDSLADMVTSGLVPGQVMYSLISFGTAPYGDAVHLFLPFAGYLVTLASAYRLARFNIDTRQHDSFIGLPTPANALFILTVGYMVQKAQYISALPLWVALLITLVSCYLLNSNLPLFSLKFKDFSLKNNAIKYIFLLLSLLLLLCFQINAFALIILAYILLSIGSNLFKNKDKNETI